MLFRSTEQIESLNKDTMLSLRTKLENHPLVDDVDQELQRIEDEKEKEIDEYSKIIPNKEASINKDGDNDAE